MIQNPDYLYTTIGSNDYLLPAGQAIVRESRIMKLQGASSFIWNLYEKDVTDDYILDQMVQTYEPEDYDEFCVLRTDVRMACAYFRDNQAVIPYEVYEQMQESSRLIESEDVRISRAADGYEASIMVDGCRYQTYLHENPRLDHYDLVAISRLRESDQLIQRIGYSRLALAEGRIFLHSVSILYRDKLWIYAASAGVGKTTHGNLWESSGMGKVINGDLNLLGLENGKIIAFGTPWCGTSGIYSLENYPVGGVIILRRGYKNYVEELAYEDQVIEVLSRSISPRWTRALLADNLAIAENIVTNCPVIRFYCKPDSEAVSVIREWIDRLI